MTYSKGVAIVYNPESGKKRNVKGVIESSLTKAKIPLKFFATERRMHAFEIANTLDLDKYDALVCVGGDGTIHELANGLLMRKDKKKIPIAFIPNGSGNDLCSSFNLDTVE